MSYTIYLAGPMSNLPAFNFPAFFDATEWLRKVMDWDVKSPAEKDLEQIPWEAMKTIPGFDTGDLALYCEHSTFTMGNAMEWDLPAIMESDGIVLLPGWEGSTGARWERTVAEALGRDIWLLGLDATGGYVVEADAEPHRLTEFLRTFPVSSEPDIPRPATDADRVLAGTLSTLWPMCSRHPADSLHIAIYVNDMAEKSLSTKELLHGLLKNLGHVPHVAELVHKIEASLG